MRTVLLRLLAGLVAAGLLLTGCGGDSSEPKSQPKDSKNSSSASPSATPSEVPAASEKTKAGAIAFAKQYVGAINHAQTTGGDTERMAAAETADCVGCAQNRKAIEDFYGPNAKVDGGDWVMGRYATKAGPAGSWLVALAVTYGPQTVDRPGTQNDEELKPRSSAGEVQAGLERRILEGRREHAHRVAPALRLVHR